MAILGIVVSSGSNSSYIKFELKIGVFELKTVQELRVIFQKGIIVGSEFATLVFGLKTHIEYALTPQK
ncbi:MAG: hypothetical protein ACTSQY_02775 [Candidatus Odinarchaeia archaeon]